MSADIRKNDLRGTRHSLGSLDLCVYLFFSVPSSHSAASKVKDRQTNTHFVPLKSAMVKTVGDASTRRRSKSQIWLSGLSQSCMPLCLWVRFELGSLHLSHRVFRLKGSLDCRSMWNLKTFSTAIPSPKSVRTLT
jgi:hypothetical protein